MLKSLFAFCSKPTKAHRTKKELQALFHRAYDPLLTPVLLCEGLEIIAANSATPPALSNSDNLLDTYIPDTSKITRLFETAEHKILVSIDDREYQVTATPWPEQPRLWLLQWTEQTQLKELSTQLIIARNHDPTSGALLPGSFSRQLSQFLPTIKNGSLVEIIIQCPNISSGKIMDEDREHLIIQMVERLTFEFGPEIFIARSGASKLCLFIETESTNEAGHILSQLNRLVIQLVGSTDFNLACANFPADGETIEHLFHSIQLAQSEARKTGKPTLFMPKFREEEDRLLQLANDMPAAIASNKITPYFQPVIDSTTGNIKSFEALVRWIHPELGYIIPPDIIQVAQNLDLLHLLTAHIMQQTMQQMIKWPDHVQFAVNVTPSQLTDELVALVRETVRTANIDPGRFEIEVTEDALIQDFDCSAKIFARLRAIGIAIAMDDFGAGYTSIGNLRKLDFTKIKIDKSISDGLPHDNKSIAIVKSLMFMARELDVEITVEGIEEQEQLEFLRAFNCGIQGYVFARPMPPKDMPEMMKFLGSSQQNQKSKTVVGIGPKRKTKGAAGSTR